MTKEQLLTVQWNNRIALAQGVPTFGFVVYATATQLWTTMTGMIILSVLGCLF